MRDHFKAGLVLEQAVSNGLAELGIEHRRTEHRGHEDVEDQLDLIVSPSVFWHDLLRPAVDLVREHLAPTRPPPSIDFRPHFMPRRLC